MGQPIAGPPHGFKGAIMKDIRKGQKSAAGRKAPPVPAILPRALSKLGFCSRTQAEELVRAGRVSVDGHIATSLETWVDVETAAIAVDGRPVVAEKRVYLMLNKPRGLVTTRHDPQGRPTVFDCLAGLDHTHLSPVGRLDKASEGLLLLTNDTRWAAQLLDPASHVDKVYHVQLDRVADEALLERLRAGVDTAEGERLDLKRVDVLRSGGRTSWLEIVLDEGRNRHIRRMLAALDVEVLRLVRVAIGPLALGTLAKGAYRYLGREEVQALARASGSGAHGRAPAAGASGTGD